MAAFAKATFKEWLEANKSDLSGYIHSKDTDEKNGRAAWASIHMPKHVVGISAWDQGNRLEVIVIDISTDEGKVEDRAYSNRDKLEARLDALLQHIVRDARLTASCRGY